MLMLAELLVVSKSVSLAVTEALFVICPGVEGTTTIVATAAPAGGKFPNMHVTGPVPLQAPCDALAETKFTPEGKVSVTFTLVAAAGPLLVTRMRYERLTPT